MVLNLGRALQDLKTEGRTQFVIGGELYTARITGSGRLKVKTMIFRGEGGYIPRSVTKTVMRAMLEEGLPQGASLDLDEESGLVILSLLLDWNEKSAPGPMAQVTEFVFMSEEWRQLLNDQGQKDLVPVRV